MNANFPEITSFGTLFRFAVELERSAERQSLACYGMATSPILAQRLQDAARKHKKRATQLEQLRQERLNEVVLQPISTMKGSDYLAAGNSGHEDLASALRGLMAFEESTARFYDDAASLTTEVLMGVDRIFRKLGTESRKIGQDIGLGY